ncbi:MAG: HAMP domain-containing histidine kinase [Clostridia bacterium]|nr:HAMP domain-containing histidine kinase [Clostridia bacterium]
MSKNKKRKNRKSPAVNDIQLNRGLSRWFVLQTLIMLGISGFTTIVMDQAGKYLQNTPELDPLRLIGFVALLIFILGIFILLEYSATKRHLEKIYNSIEMLARGHYGHRLKVGKYTVFRSLAVDINRLSDELKKVHMLRSDFVNSYSHEFKTPIASISGFAQLLLDESNNLTEEERKQYLQIIAQEAERLSKLSSNTFLLSQLESQKILADTKPYSLDEQLRRCVIMLSSQWSEKNINVIGNIDEVTFNGDEDLMQHLWLNLINNAIKFTPEGGTIEVSLKQNGEKITATVADNGIGMSEEMVQRIFDKYYQGSTDKATAGLGLGLSIAYRIVILCKGRIKVESKLGEGSKFIVELKNKTI